MMRTTLTMDKKGTFKLKGGKMPATVNITCDIGENLLCTAVLATGVMAVKGGLGLLAKGGSKMGNMIMDFASQRK